MIRTIAPLYERQHPTARRIAAQLPAPLLSLRTRRLVADIRERFGCGNCTARTAVALARRGS
jgi:hypothetical protein